MTVLISAISLRHRTNCLAAATLLLVGLAPAVLWAQPADDRTPVYLPQLEVTRLQGEIEVDGFLEDTGWERAAMASNFAEHNPGDQTIPEVDTDVLITYDDDNLYLAWICYDDPTEVRATYCERDNIFDDDNVILALDTYGEGALAYEIAVNPYGIPGDLIFSASSGEDISYEMVFESAGRITDEGYVVEMAIPFSNLRFPDQEQQVWRADFWRNRPRESRYQYSWAAYDRDESCWPCQWGTLTGISGIESGKGFEILPSLVTFQEGSLGEDGGFVNEPATLDNVELGLGISYDISSEFTAEATINPDFSQVESDAAQIDINTTFALFYPEQRPFFQEGSDLFRTYFNAVYTRSINDPIVAAKVTGRTGKSSIAFLSAVDENSVITLPFEESSEYVLNGRSVSNILRYRRDLGEQNHLGLVATDRRFQKGGSGSLVGLDGRYRLSPNDALEFQFLATNTQELDDPALTEGITPETFDNGQYTAALDGEKFWGHGVYGSYERQTSNFWLDLDYRERSPTFRADSGFENSNDQRMGFWNSGYHIRFDDSPTLERITPQFNLGRKWNWDGTKKDEWYNANLSVNLRAAQTGFHARVMQSNELFQATQFDGLWLAHICGNTSPSGSLSFGGNYDYGHRIARFHLVMGKETTFGVWADVKLFDRLVVSTRFAKATSKSVDTGEDLFSDNILRSRFSYQVSREFSARLVIQFRDRWLNGGGYRRTWEADPLLTYQINPFSTFFIGSTRDYFDLNLGQHGIDGWRLTDRTYFMKLQYLFQV